MGFGFLKKKRDKVIPLEEAELRVLNLIEAAERGLHAYISRKYPELKHEVENLLYLFENFITTSCICIQGSKIRPRASFQSWQIYGKMYPI